MSETYNAATFTASDLLTSIYRACKLPDSGTTDYTPAVVLSMATEAIHTWGGQLLSGARDGRLCTTTLRSLADDSVDTSGYEYRLPPMALADTIDSVAWVDDDDSGRSRSLQLVPLSMEPIFRGGTETGAPTCYALSAGTIRVYPRPDGRGQLKITYMRRHGVLVIGSDTSSITGFTGLGDGTTRLELATMPSSFVVDVWVDVFGPYYPYRTLISGQVTAMTTSGGNYLSIDALYLDTLAAVDVGSTVVLYGKTPYVQLPLEMKQPLVEMVAQRITAELGDYQLSTGFSNMAKEGSAAARDMLSPRAKSDRQKLVNPFSLARGGHRRRLWGGGRG